MFWITLAIGALIGAAITAIVIGLCIKKPDSRNKNNI
ncbi:hypothetical protein MAMMFC1_00757 [Methylomusa anaerophila]|uniref:Uncharacterized protein n=1 Tax=Methylomusa anaerophila TaxID=1930071 RepID=A0A348AGB1_9FIRM|nr:hypothetical protein MAMMFC1_00757 [Methylomusa anaerophila]